MRPRFIRPFPACLLEEWGTAEWEAITERRHSRPSAMKRESQKSLHWICLFDTGRIQKGKTGCCAYFYKQNLPDRICRTIIDIY